MRVRSITFFGGVTDDKSKQREEIIKAMSMNSPGLITMETESESMLPFSFFFYQQTHTC